MEQIKSLPIDMDTWKQMNYDPLYYVPTNPLDVVAQSTIKFYKHQLIQFDNQLSEENKEIFRNSIITIENLMIK